MTQTRLVPLLDPEADVLDLFDPFLARRYRALPLRREADRLIVVMSNPLDLAAIQEIEFLTGLRVEPVRSSPAAVDAAIARNYAMPESATDGLRAAPATTDPPLVAIQRRILSDAVQLGASDIHIDPSERQTRIRYRVDGVLEDRAELPQWLHEQLVARIKVMARLDISERRLPQDGHIVDRHEGIDGRLSTMPTDRGEAVVIRLFRDRERLPTIDGLGAGRDVETRLKAIGQRSQGILIVAGPTGSGKTTTLYAIIDELRARPLNIVTIEDPIEYRVNGVRQIQVDERLRLTFSRALRSVLRQDPDVILVGEIRDPETARIAFDAALTGHLVLSTLHATDASSTLLRLHELGVDRSVVASAMIGTLAQRLVRQNCSGCLQPDSPERFYIERLGIRDSEARHLRRSCGCAGCGFTGVGGRIPMFEILEANREIRGCLAEGSERRLRQALACSGFVPLLKQAKRHVLDGTIGIEEAYRTCYFGEGI